MPESEEETKPKEESQIREICLRSNALVHMPGYIAALQNDYNLRDVGTEYRLKSLITLLEVVPTVPGGAILSLLRRECRTTEIKREGEEGRTYIDLVMHWDPSA